MNINTLLTNSNANAFFGTESYSFPLSSTVLAATLRYIAIVHCHDTIEKVSPIKVETTSFSIGSRGNDFATSFANSSNDMLIAESRSGADLPFIDADGWIALDTPPYPVAPFLSKASLTAVYLNSELKKVILFVKKATERWIDELCSSLFRILPWIYTEGYRLSEGELALFKSAHDRDEARFTEIINELARRYDFRAMITKRSLMGWNNGYRDTQIRNIESQYTSVQEKIAAKEQEIAALYSELDGYIFNLNALRNQAPDDNDALYNFFQSHRQLGVYKVDIRSSGKTLYYTITDTIEYYDQDAFIRMRNNPNSYFNSFRQDVRDIMNAIFADNKAQIRVESVFTLTNLSSITPASRNLRSGNFDGTHLPHPHIVHYNCLGGNGTPITQYLRSGDWDLAIEQTIAATKNINFGDSAVVSSFARDIISYMDKCKCIIFDDGREMTPKEFLDYIRMAETNEGDNNG